MTADRCDCTFSNWADHDRMLRIFDDPSVLIDLIDRTASTATRGDDDEELIVGEELSSFIGQHNWPDPVSAYHLGCHLEHLFRAAQTVREQAYERNLAAQGLHPAS